MTKYFLHLSLLTVLIAPHMLRTATCDDCLDFSYDSIASCYLEDDDFDKEPTPAPDLPIDHVCDPEMLPQEIPTNLQKKLAWGLLKLDKQVVREALDAGANPNMNLNHFMIDDAYEGWISAYALAAKSAKMYTDAHTIPGKPSSTNTATFMQHYQNMVPLWELLIIRGASVDTDIEMSVGSMRKIVKESLKTCSDSHDFKFTCCDLDDDCEFIRYSEQEITEDPDIKELRTYSRIAFTRLQGLINIYQPEKTKPRVH